MGEILTPIQLLGCEVLFCKSAFHPVSAWAAWLHDIFPSQVQDFAFAVGELHEVSLHEDFSSLSMSLWKTTLSSSILTVPPTLVLPANLLRVCSTLSSTSSMTMLNSFDPSISPWGTWFITRHQWYYKCLKLSFFTHLTVYLSGTNLLNLAVRMLKENVPKILLKPRSMTSSALPLSSGPAISSQKTVMLNRHDLLLVNPFWPFLIPFLAFVHLEMSSQRICSVTFPGTDLGPTVLQSSCG